MRNIVITLFLTVSYSILETGYGQRKKCGVEKFQCKNGECIASVLLCDGRPDCKDESDETFAECTKPYIICPHYAFRCAYGACVDGDATCNGVKDCIDNSDETLSRCNSSNNASTVCLKNQFKCNNGECISRNNLCDGNADCTDSSDETFIQCGALPCEQFFFRCRYGACIDIDLKCNGVINCVDGSDEDPKLCTTTVRPTTRPVTPPVTYPVTPPTSKPKVSCIAPAQPQNGFWKLHKSQCSTGEDCNVEQGVRFDPGAYLIYSCNRGYKIEGRPDVICGLGGEWLYIPRCIEVRCKNLNSAAVSAEYSYFGSSVVSYDSPKPNTVATLKCRNSYREDQRFSSSASVTCNENGQWEPEPMRCLAVCGVVPANVKPLIVNGTQANITQFPWHATLYRAQTTDAPKEFICGATIIQDSLLVTAAHCVSDDSWKYYVAAGNIFRDYDSSFHNAKYVKKATVEEVHISCDYNGILGSYAADIAVLKITEPFVFSSLLQPICLDFSNNILLDPEMYGRVAGFGRTATGSSSFVLQTLTLPFVPKRKCTDASVTYETQNYITYDKLCAGYTNGSSVCEGDSGGGLIFQWGSLWYLKGIVSVSLGTRTVGGTRQCDSTTYTLYTAVSFHMSWVEQFLHSMELLKPLPTCNAKQ
ncbi:coagulation factor X [Nomia melanderi]|uniref:coagulation factor X n=1 Tax=Nomia melanderi TaxID=2448451 RepID=UPI00130414EE|nr:modular serine protease-like [Nomia melanderi]